MKKLLKKLLTRETLLYCVFGVLGTIVNYAAFWLFYDIIFSKSNSLAANAIAFICAVIFAYVTNKLFVFESKSWSFDVIKKELPSFFGARLASFLIEEAGLFVSEHILKLDGVTVLSLGSVIIDGVAIAKIALSVLVVIINYVFCKFIIFKK